MIERPRFIPEEAAHTPEEFDSDEGSVISDQVDDVVGEPMYPEVIESGRVELSPDWNVQELKGGVKALVAQLPSIAERSRGFVENRLKHPNRFDITADRLAFRVLLDIVNETIEEEGEGSQKELYDQLTRFLEVGQQMLTLDRDGRLPDTQKGLLRDYVRDVKVADAGPAEHEYVPTQEEVDAVVKKRGGTLRDLMNRIQGKNER